jgi:MFS family permease
MSGRPVPVSRSRRLVRRGAFLGWWMLAICGLVVFGAAYGQTYTVSAFVDPVLADLGVSRSLLSIAYALGTGIGGLVILVLGRQIDRWGNRRVMVMGVVGLSAGLLVLSFAAGPWWLFLGFPLIRTFGQGTMPLAARVLIPNWFFRSRARAFSLLGLATTASIAFLPLLNEWLIDRVGWRMAWRLAAVALVVVIVPVVLRFVRNRPEDVGQLPDGAKVDAATGLAPVTDAGVGLTLTEAKRTPAFWGLVAAGAVPPLITTGLHLHQAAIFADRGTPQAIATATFSIEAVSMLTATLALGWLNDRISPRITLGCALLMMALTLVALLFAGNPVIAVAYGALRGASNGTMAIAIDVAWPTYYGRKYLGSIRGFGMAASLFGSAIGPLPFGLATELFGGYAPTILALTLLPLAVATIVFVTRPPRLDLATAPTVRL